MTRPIRVLMIEDNPADADLMRETLDTERIQLELSVAPDGVDGLARLMRRAPYEAEPPPDLVLLDLNLPKLDGRALMAQLRLQGEATRRIPVVVFSSSDLEADIVQSYELGANCYVTKPMGLQAFESIVRSIEQFWLGVARLP